MSSCNHNHSHSGLAPVSHHGHSHDSVIVMDVNDRNLLVQSGLLVAMVDPVTGKQTGEYRIDTDRIIVADDDAGAQLVATVQALDSTQIAAIQTALGINSGTSAADISAALSSATVPELSGINNALISPLASNSLTVTTVDGGIHQNNANPVN